DLNGFTLTGVTGSLAGVTTSISTATRLNNGTVQGWEDDGVRLSDFAVVTRVTTRDNVGGGINVGQSAVVTDCIAEGNDEQGFVANAGSALTSCVARNNTLDGFVLNACTVTGCTARVNGGSGFALQTAGVLSSCSGSSNSDNGATIATSGAFSSLVVDCAFSSNGADGISVSGNSTIRGCTLTGNGTGAATGAGLRIAGSDCRIEGNHCTDNERGILASAAGNFIVRNTCAGNTTNWELVANNVVGPIVDRTAPASAAILGNAAPSSLGTTDPNANFSY
ncbi:MAG TPA: right-handed parallel beta-helix repeat-containing protein, partial [Phycisphaerales bacterium]|nr:right-handed parallel beta-helix repeat-containing protein [Phycisphaerales bacterium]